MGPIQTVYTNAIVPSTWQCMRERFSKFKKYGSFLPGQSFALKYELKGVFRVTELRELPGRHDLQHRMFLGGEEDRSSCQTEAERNSLKDPNPLHKILKKYAIQVVCTSSLRRPASLATPRPAWSQASRRRVGTRCRYSFQRRRQNRRGSCLPGVENWEDTDKFHRLFCSRLSIT